MRIQDYVYGDDGLPINGATVEVWEYGGGAAVASTTTNASGLYNFTGLADNKKYRVKIVWGGQTRWVESDSYLQVTQIVGANGTHAPLPAASVTGSMIVGGAGSGVAADTLDGEHKDYFATAGHTHDYANNFNTINVNGTPVVADQLSDTLNLTDSGLVTLTPTAGTDTIDIGVSLSYAEQILGVVTDIASGGTNVLSVSLAAGTWLILGSAMVEFDGNSGDINTFLMSLSTMGNEATFLADQGQRYSYTLFDVAVLAETTTVHLNLRKADFFETLEAYPYGTRLVAVRIG